MKNFFDKTKTASITLILMLTISAIILALPTVTAHDPPREIQVYRYAVVRPNPVGVGQEALVMFWPNMVPPTAVSAYGDRYTWNVEITKPDGTKQTLGPYTSDPVGGGWAIFTPDQLGTYTIVAIMEDHLVTGEPVPPWDPRGTEYIGDTLLGGPSDPVTLTVQENSVEPWTETPLPEQYWTRPINTANRNWWQLAGNWLGGAAQQNGPTTQFGYGPATESAHIMWTRPFWAGGIMDERFGDTGYQTAQYDGLGFEPPIILNGKVYYNTMGQPKYGWNCLNLYTGELEYFYNTTGPVIVGTYGGSGNGVVSPYALRSDSSGAILGGWLQFGQILNYDSPNQHGGYPYLIGRGPNGETNFWMIFDAFSNNYLCSIANVSNRGTQVYGKDGSILYYNINGDRLTCWNSTHAVEMGYTDMRAYDWCWRPYLNNTFDGNDGFSLDVAIPIVQGSIRCVREGEFIIGGTSGKNNGTYVEDGHLWALSLEPGKEGTLLWNRTFTPPQGPPDEAAGTFGMGSLQGPTVDPEDGVFLFSESINRRRWGYDLETCEMLWGPTESESPLNYYGMSSNIYDGKLLSCGYGGELIAYDIRTGDILWTYTAENVGFESPYGNYPTGIVFIADSKIYLTSSEHSPTQPLWRGPNLRCIDAETGDEVWKTLFWGAGMGSGTGAVIADGYIVGLNFYDNQLYCFGKGPSATTVTGPETSIPLGEEVLIKGTVIDTAAGTMQEEQAARFSSGVPAVSDESMSAWMEFVYMQQPCPEDATGVEVVLTTLDPNGNTYELGRTTTDLSGTFGLTVDTPVPGRYKITATFEGSDSYYGSYAVTYINVKEAQSASQQMEPELSTPEPVESSAESTAEAPLITTETAIIAAVIIAVAIIAGFWITRKRK
jgi:hypothetical protein